MRRLAGLGENPEAVQSKEIERHGQKFSPNGWVLDASHRPFVYAGIPIVDNIRVGNESLHLADAFLRVPRSYQRVTLNFDLESLVGTGIGNSLRTRNFIDECVPQAFSNLIDPI